MPRHGVLGGGRNEVVGYAGNHDVPAIQGVADYEILQSDFHGDEPGEEDAAVAGVAKVPRERVRDEGEDEVSGLPERAGFRGGAVGRPGGEESSVSARSDEPEDSRGAEGPEAAEELGFGDDAAEGGAGGGGADEVDRGVEAQEDVLPDLVGEEDGLRGGASGGPPSRRGRCWLWERTAGSGGPGSRRRRCLNRAVGQTWRKTADSGGPPWRRRRRCHRAVGRLWERTAGSGGPGSCRRRCLNRAVGQTWRKTAGSGAPAWRRRRRRRHRGVGRPWERSGAETPETANLGFRDSGFGDSLDDGWSSSVRVCTRCGLTRLDGWKVTFFFTHALSKKLHMPCRKKKPSHAIHAGVVLL